MSNLKSKKCAKLERANSIFVIIYFCSSMSMIAYYSDLCLLSPKNIFWCLKALTINMSMLKDFRHTLLYFRVICAIIINVNLALTTKTNSIISFKDIHKLIYYAVLYHIVFLYYVILLYRVIVLYHILRLHNISYCYIVMYIFRILYCNISYCNIL